MSDSRTIVTRFAPSPSGHLHVGGARTALFCWAYAAAREGRFILRIEDTDQKRSSETAGLAFLEDLKWLGIDWQEGPEFESCGGGANGPYRQSERLEIYRRFTEQLIDSGHAYRAFETTEELTAARDAARAEKRDYRYDRGGLKLDQATIDQYLAENRPFVVRFKCPDQEEIIVQDEVLGEVRTAMSQLDDFVIVKADGFPTYHFAVVVDDEQMEVSHVIRGQEHLSNTAKHILLQDALGFRRPLYGHVSTITNPDRSKMSKRDKDKALRRTVRERKIEAPPLALDGQPSVAAGRWTWWLEKKDHQLDLAEAVRLAETLEITLPEINVDDFRRAGYLPEVLINYLALLGWSPGDDIERFDRAFLLERFDLDRIIKSPASFDRDKLLSFNLDALKEMSPDEFVEQVTTHCRAYHPEFLERLNDEQFRMLALANKGRSKTLDDQIASSRFFIIDDDAIVYEQTKAVRKALCNGDTPGYGHLEALLPQLDILEPWTPESIESAVGAYAEASADGKLGKVAQPLRIAVSGGTISPAIFETLAILGRERVVNRIRRCLEQRSALCASS